MLSGHVKNEEKKSNYNIMELKLILSSRNAEIEGIVFIAYLFCIKKWR